MAMKFSPAFSPFTSADLLVKILVEAQRFRRAARLAGNQEERFGKVDGFLDAGHIGRNGRVQHLEFQDNPAARPEGGAQDVRTQAAAAHAEQHGVPEPRLPDFSGEAFEGVLLLPHLAGDGEPAESVANDFLRVRAQISTAMASRSQSLWGNFCSLKLSESVPDAVLSRLAGTAHRLRACCSVRIFFFFFDACQQLLVIVRKASTPLSSSCWVTARRSMPIPGRTAQ